MLRTLRLSATGLAILAAALIAGFFYAYYCSVMVGFSAAEPHIAIAAMQAINATVRNMPFAFGFFGTLGFGLFGCLLTLNRLRRPATAALWFGVVLYALGAFAVTMLLNVPLNEALAAAGLNAETAAGIWQTYARPWEFWNIVRMVASCLALGAYTLALVLEFTERPSQ